jgi:hypothetical protein
LKIEAEEPLERTLRISNYRLGSHPDEWIPFQILDQGIMLQANRGTGEMVGEKNPETLITNGASRKFIMVALNPHYPRLEPLHALVGQSEGQELSRNTESLGLSLFDWNYRGWTNGVSETC